ncbi:hypothetical protein [Shewanella baltica]|uniref:hypothetical protein n=1 Tax=Shewanella baltica TaxID=62322 RepID=UPI00325F67BD
MGRMGLAGGTEQTTDLHGQARIIRPPRKAEVQNRQGAIICPDIRPSPQLSAVQLSTAPRRYSRRFCVRRVEALFAFAKHILVLCPAGQRTAVQDGSRPSCADKVEAQVNAAQTRVNNLTQSILAKAFRGELTADWRAANPELISGESSAEALLEKIKFERQFMLGKKTRKKA